MTKLFEKFVKNQLNYSNFGFVITSIVLGMYLNWRTGNIAFLALIVLKIINPIKTKILIYSSLVLVFFIPISQMAKKPDFAEDLGIAIYAILIVLFIRLVRAIRCEKME